MDVYAPAPTPTIDLKENHMMFPIERCVPVCSVENGKDVNLSWYREKERISTTNSSESSAYITLPLDLSSPNNSTYTCVAANPVSTQTAQPNLTGLCYNNTDSKSTEPTAPLTPGSSVAERYNGIQYTAGSQQNDTQPCEPSVSFMSEIA
ncbi:hypothetical protein SRHO_G00254160 [Serrasalmus rhombeus]